MKLHKKFIVLMVFIPSIVLATSNQNIGLSPNATPAQAQQYIDTSEDCMIVQNKKQIVLKCGGNMIFVTSKGIGIKTPTVSKFWS